MLVGKFLTEQSNILKMRAFGEVSNRMQLPSVDRKAKVKCNLFGPVDPESLSSFVHKELRKKEKLSKEQWGYDFAKDRPLATHKRYIWKPVVKAAAPRVYTLTHSAHLRQLPYDRRCEYSTEEEELMDERAQRSNDNRKNTLSDRIHVAADLSTSSEETSPSKPSHKRVTSSIVKKKRQPKITDYLKERKRQLVSNSKLLDDAITKHRSSMSIQTRSCTLTTRQLLDRH